MALLCGMEIREIMDRVRLLNLEDVSQQQKYDIESNGPSRPQLTASFLNASLIFLSCIGLTCSLAGFLLLMSLEIGLLVVFMPLASYCFSHETRKFW